jgi:hypothetical protein
MKAEGEVNAAKMMKAESGEMKRSRRGLGSRKFSAIQLFPQILSAFRFHFSSIFS